MTAGRAEFPILGFQDRRQFERWLEARAADAPGLWVRFAKKGAEAPGLAKSEAIDAALCHGWIDGQIGKGDEIHWLVRFTPRKPRSRWSEINRTRALRLIEAGRMREAGLRQVEAARADGRWDSACAPASSIEVSADLREALDASPAAAAFFATLSGANRYAVLYRIGAVKRPETRTRKIATVVAMLARGEIFHRR